MSIQDSLTKPIHHSTLPKGYVEHAKDLSDLQITDTNTAYNAFNVLERDLIIESLTRYGSIRKVGQALGVSHTTVIKKMRKYGIKR